MRSALFLALGVIAGCGGSAASGAGASRPLSADSDPVVLELPTPAADVGTTEHAAIPRSSIPVGSYALTLSTSFHHGCSRSWQSTSTHAKAKLEIGSGVATLDVNEESNSTIGSRGPGGEAHHTKHTRTARLRGLFVEVGPGKLQASLHPIACEGDCDDTKVELTCEVRKIPIDDRDPPGGRAEEPRPGAGGTIEGMVCTGIGSIIGGRVTDGELPLGPGPGVEVDHTDFGYGSGASKTYRAVASLDPKP